jgi:acyl carrier protein
MPEQDDRQVLSPTEIAVSEIWMEVLQIDRLSPKDNFFEQGGDSLMTMMMLFRVSDDLNVEMPPDAIMEAPTLREFCLAIDNKKTADGGQDSAGSTDDTETGVI